MIVHFRFPPFPFFLPLHLAARPLKGLTIVKLRDQQLILVSLSVFHVESPPTVKH
jgi:hypothetical protein